jgi:thiamine pyrophosphate-dependent acetolactate synthase large subunit-like protein
MRVSNPDELRTALAKAITLDGPTIIEAHQERDLPAPWQYILEAPVRGPKAAPGA